MCGGGGDQRTACTETCPVQHPQRGQSRSRSCSPMCRRRRSHRRLHRRLHRRSHPRHSRRRRRRRRTRRHLRRVPPAQHWPRWRESGRGSCPPEGARTTRRCRRSPSAVPCAAVGHPSSPRPPRYSRAPHALGRRCASVHHSLGRHRQSRRRSSGARGWAVRGRRRGRRCTTVCHIPGN